MPNVWTEPDEVITHNGVTVYHTYKDGEYISAYWYTLNESDDDWEGESAFDVRELNAYDSDKSHEEILRTAIENSELQAPEEEPMRCRSCGRYPCSCGADERS